MHRAGSAGQAHPLTPALAWGELGPSHAVQACAERVGCRRTPACPAPGLWTGHPPTGSVTLLFIYTTEGGSGD